VGNSNSPTGREKVVCVWKAVVIVFILAASKPSAYLGAMVGGGASGATSQLTSKKFKK
jgi:hypothetical protein